MEFLGDSVLSIIVSEYLYAKMDNVNEGDLSRIRAALVCEESLADVARKMEIGKYIFLGKGEEKAGSRNRASILSDVFEAILAAVYLDAGMDKAKEYIFDVMGDVLCDAIQNKTQKDYKSRLQELVQQRYHGRTQIEYNTIKENGPEHKKVFLIELSINGKVISSGEGFSKKEAEQLAAKNALSDGNVL